ncbi:hypothetical protein ACMDCR_12180 [Labrys okinawensis]|uniref:hypothetical protein n=1 Tax=Labrys okinawensis TaxID=346911 RepID=UPI0039BD0B84
MNEPFLVELAHDFIEAVPDAIHRQRMANSNFVAFGSKLVTGFSSWSSGRLISSALLPIAAAVFTFDAIVQNPDRRDGNPNCLVSGDSIRIIDHELTFGHRLILLWRPPWQLGSLRHLKCLACIFFDQAFWARTLIINLSGTRGRTCQMPASSNMEMPYLLNGRMLQPRSKVRYN